MTSLTIRLSGFEIQLLSGYKMLFKKANYLILTVLCLLFLQLGCSSTQSYLIREKDSFKSNEIIKLPDYSANERKFGNVILLPHQYYPIEYLNNNPNVKGLLINHYLGTGKTYLALGFAESSKAKSVIIIVPQFLVSNWSVQMRNFGIKDLGRYEIITMQEAPKKLTNRDLSQSIIIVDEVHKLINLMDDPNLSLRISYSKLYQHIRSAKRILALTGTPIFNGAFDVSYLINLVSGENLLPLNKEIFRTEYTKIMPVRSQWRGFFTESVILPLILPTVGAFTVLALVPLSATAFLAGAAIGAIGGFGIAPLFNNALLPLEIYPLRSFDAQKLSVLTKTYTSFYTFGDDAKDFPVLESRVMDVDYSDPQLEFFFDFAELALEPKQLNILLREGGNPIDTSLAILESTPLQQDMVARAGSGREIGNLSFRDETGLVTESPKFVAITDMLKQNSESTVIYSNYYENGILLFADHLDRNGFKNKYKILLPEQPLEVHEKIISDYNDGKIKILLLHPDITEGISLKGTQYFHILEPVLNNALLEQIVGRAVRYQSHSHLAKDKQLVEVFIWKATINFMGYSASTIRIKNWKKKYGELSNWSGWGSGLRQVDPNYNKKQYSPDDFAFIKLKESKVIIKDMKLILQTNSIESCLSSKTCKTRKKV